MVGKGDHELQPLGYAKDRTIEKVGRTERIAIVSQHQQLRHERQSGSGVRPGVFV